MGQTEEPHFYVPHNLLSSQGGLPERKKKLMNEIRWPETWSGGNSQFLYWKTEI
jgi:hypothetical protein